VTCHSGLTVLSLACKTTLSSASQNILKVCNFTTTILNQLSTLVLGLFKAVGETHFSPHMVSIVHLASKGCHFIWKNKPFMTKHKRDELNGGNLFLHSCYWF
jgi:hypothetical protein